MTTCTKSNNESVRRQECLYVSCKQQRTSEYTCSLAHGLLIGACSLPGSMHKPASHRTITVMSMTTAIMTLSTSGRTKLYRKQIHFRHNKTMAVHKFASRGKAHVLKEEELEPTKKSQVDEEQKNSCNKYIFGVFVNHPCHCIGHTAPPQSHEMNQ